MSGKPSREVVPQETLAAGTVRLELSRSMVWDREANTMQMVETAVVYTQERTRDGRKVWRKAGLPFVGPSEGSRAELLELLAKYLSVGEVSA